jgi:TetR/AcrR family transcriptional repressor of mexJK operon
LKVPNPRLAANLLLAMFMGDGHVRGLLMLDMPDAREDKALLREVLRSSLPPSRRADDSLPPPLC